MLMESYEEVDEIDNIHVIDFHLYYFLAIFQYKNIVKFIQKF